MANNNMTHKSRKARDKAREYFGLKPGDDDFVLHHVDITLKKRNPERYHEWRPEDLCIMTRSEHNRLHKKGKKLSEENKQKLIDANKKPVCQYTLNGEFVKEWPSMMDAEKEGGFCRSHIAAVCKGKLKQHKNYVWRYANNNTEK